MKQPHKYIIGTGGSEAIIAQQINRILSDIEVRLNELEYKNLKVGKKPEISRSEKSALLYELGLMDFLLSLKISQNKIAKLLSLIIGASQANIEKDLSTRHNLKASFKNEETYKHVVTTFKNLKLFGHLNKAMITLTKIESSKEK